MISKVSREVRETLKWSDGVERAFVLKSMQKGRCLPCQAARTNFGDKPPGIEICQLHGINTEDVLSHNDDMGMEEAN